MEESLTIRLTPDQKKGLVRMAAKKAEESGEIVPISEVVRGLIDSFLAQDCKIVLQQDKKKP